jgi:glycerol kinase
MRPELILAIDQGTTNTKALLVNRDGEAIFQASMAIGLLQPQPGYVEQDPLEIWQSVCAVASQCIAHVRQAGGTIAGIAITNQRETALAWDPASRVSAPAGKPLTSAISWQCRRSAKMCDRLSPHAQQIRDVTGLPLDPLLTASKWMWLFESQADLMPLAQAGRLRLGTVDSWLIANFTGGEVHATDHSNASRTALLCLATLDWDEEMLHLFGVPRAALPRIVPSSGVIGLCTSIPELAGVPIVAAIGDSHAALVGHGCFSSGSVKATYGTGSSLMMLTDGLALPAETLARTIAWSNSESVRFALEGNIAMTGAAVQWVGEFLGLAHPTQDAVALAETVADSSGLMFVPAMVGLGAPYWDKAARGTIANLERYHTRAHLARAALESIAFQIADVFFAMEALVASDLPFLLADGGASRNDTLMQMQADALLKPVRRAGSEELSALGSAWLGGVALGWWQSLEDIGKQNKQDVEFAPRIARTEWQRRSEGWKLALRRAQLREVHA